MFKVTDDELVTLTGAVSSSQAREKPAQRTDCERADHARQRLNTSSYGDWYQSVTSTTAASIIATAVALHSGSRKSWVTCTGARLAPSADQPIIIYTVCRPRRQVYAILPMNMKPLLFVATVDRAESQGDTRRLPRWYRTCIACVEGGIALDPVTGGPCANTVNAEPNPGRM